MTTIFSGRLLVAITVHIYCCYINTAERIAFLKSAVIVFTGLHLHTVSTNSVRCQMLRLVDDCSFIH